MNPNISFIFNKSCQFECESYNNNLKSKMHIRSLSSKEKKRRTRKKKRATISTIKISMNIVIPVMIVFPSELLFEEIAASKAVKPKQIKIMIQTPIRINIRMIIQAS